MPELPFSTLSSFSHQPGLVQHSRSAVSEGQVLPATLLGRASNSFAMGTPHPSPIMATIGDHLSSCASSCDGTEEITAPTPQNAGVEAAPHSEHLVSDLKDIVESGRTFSDLSNPATIRKVCVTKIPTWNIAVKEEDVKVSQIMAGLTNQLFRVHLKENVCPGIIPRQVLLRVYGATVGDLYDPAFELEVFKLLSKHESAPKLIAEFPGGRIEEYILGPALLVKDARNPAVACAIATILGKFHKLQDTVPEIQSWNTGEAAVWKSLKRWSEKALALYQVATRTLDQAHETERQQSCESVTSTESLVKEKARRMSQAAKINLVKKLEQTGIVEMFEEVQNLRNIVLPSGAEENPITRIAFCHNDVQENNILVTGTRLRLIDFEYSDFNYPAFDIANFLCETTIDYCVNEFPFFAHDTSVAAFPSEELIRLFGSVYLSELLQTCVMPSDKRLEAFVASVYRFVLTSHAVWGFWSIIRAPQAATSSDFDFLLYAQSRFDAYRSWKSYLLTKGLIKA